MSRDGSEGGSARGQAVATPKRPQDVVIYGGLSLLRCFAGRQFRVTAVDTDPESLTLRSRIVRRRELVACPMEHPEALVEDLLRIGRSFDEPPMLAWDNDNMVLLVSRYRETLSRHYRFLLPDAQLIEDLVGKLRFADFAKRLDLPVPRSLVPDGEVTAEQIAQQVGLPCILKPNTHVGQFRQAVTQHEHDRPHKVLLARTMDELRERLRQIKTYCDAFIAQEYIPGDDRCLYSFHTYITPAGEPLGCFIGRKIRTYPKDTGFSTYLELTYEPHLIELGLDLLRRMNYVGPMKLDFKKDIAHNRYLLLECNARFTLWNYLAAVSGMNLPQMAAASLRGQELPRAIHYRVGTRWLSLGGDLRSFLREYRPAGQWTWPRYLASLCGPHVHEIFSWRDPIPGMICAGRYISANLRKAKRKLLRRTPAHLAPAT